MPRRSRWVTGAGSGIGRALARRFARAGAALALADVDAEGLAEATRQRDGGGSSPARKLTTHPLEVSDRARFSVFADEVVARHGRVNLLVNNAGAGMIESTACD